MRLVVPAIAFALAGCALADDASIHAPLIGGAIIDDPAVVAVMTLDPGAGMRYLCTGALIGDAGVLLARHCVDRASGDATRIKVYFTGDFYTTPGTEYAVHEIITEGGAAVTPGGGLTDVARDVAVLGLEVEAPVAPKTVIFDPASGVGPVTLVGLGRTRTDNLDGVGIERHGSATGASYSDEILQTTAIDARTCNGDSGGPVLDAAGRIVAVNSASDCTTTGYSPRPYGHEALILRGIRYHAGGCAATDTCGNGIDEDCTGDADEACGVLGEPCERDVQCASGMCRDGICTTPCSGDGECEAGYSCDEVCLPVPPSTCGDGDLDAMEVCDDGNTDDGDGCSARCLAEEGPPLTDGGTPPDAETPRTDAATPDASTRDAGTDAGAIDDDDGGAPLSSDDEGGCRAAGRSAPSFGALVLFAIVVTRRRRRR